MRHPHVLLDIDEVHAAVADLKQEPVFVVDVETTKARPRNNELLWVGLGAFGRSYLIPVGHPKGNLITPERKVRTPACLAFPNDDRGLTKTGKPSMRMVDVRHAAVYEPPPKQLFPDEVCAAIKPLLWSDSGKLGHNVKFDLMSLAKYYGDEIPPGPYHDTIILRHCLAEDLEQYDLKTLTCEWFRIGVHPTGWVDHKKRQRWYPNLGDKGIENFGLDEVARYLNKDVRYCWMMFQSFRKMLKRKGVEQVYDFEMSVYRVVMEMEYAGFPIDLSERQTVIDWLAEEQARVRTEAADLAGDEFDLNDLPTKRWVLFGHGKQTGRKRDGSPIYEQTPKFGASKMRYLQTQGLRIGPRTKVNRMPQVTQEVLAEAADKGDPMALLLLEWSGLEKLRGTFIEGLGTHLRYTDTGLPTIHTSFKQHGTVTGRFSASEPNLQQLPRGDKIRRMFVAGPGYTLIVADYDQIELRGAALLSGDPVMTQVFREGQDIHRRAAAVMFQIALDIVSDMQRAVGKVQNFGTLYGAGEEKIAAVAGVSTRRAAAFIRNYYKEFAALEPWKADLLKAARERGNKANPLYEPPYVIIQPNGRRRRLPELYSLDDWRRWHAERQAVNAEVQGFASNITKLAMLDLRGPLSEIGASMVAQVHDEIVVRCPLEMQDLGEELVTRVMQGVLDPRTGAPILGEIPLVASAKSGQSWAAAKAKG